MQKPRALVVGIDPSARERLRTLLAAEFEICDAASVPAAQCWMRQHADDHGAAPPVVVVYSSLASEAAVMSLGLRRSTGPRPFPILVVLDSDEPFRSDASNGTPDSILRGSVQPTTVIEHVRLLARVGEAEDCVQRMRRYLPAPLYESIILTGRARPSSRRWLSVLFCDIRGFTDATDFCESDETLGVLNDYFSATAAAVARYGGTVDKFMGDGAISYFAAEDGTNNALQAVRAAIDLREAVEELRVSWFGRGVLPVGIGLGVATGWVILGTIGDRERADYTVIGNVVNLAARLQSRAKGGHIIVCGETCTRVRHAVSVDQGHQVQIKGFDQPIRVHGVIGRVENGLPGPP